MSKAERLAQWIEDEPLGDPLDLECAAELRRLSAINSELIEALKACHATLTDTRIGQWSYMEGSEIYSDFSEAAEKSSAAISKAEATQCN